MFYFPSGDEDMKADLYEHIKESKDKEKPRREQTLDAATNDQAEKQTVQEDEVDEKEDENNEGGEDVPSGELSFFFFAIGIKGPKMVQ